MSGAPHAEAEGVVSKVKVKKEIKTIVENLETILGDLKDVAKELKEALFRKFCLTEGGRLTSTSQWPGLCSSSSSSSSSSAH
ncbi:hypothetical protein AMECASPLE_030395 [Ameca splendens]|uniref:Uncharacterized protein n=1 Tax=Ameca splendens TaxID=208324 RepID=A0ABV1ADI4_9TELE